MGILLTYLAREKGVLAFDSQTVKLKAPGEKKAPPITNEDTTIASLKILIQDLETQTTLLAKRVDSLGEIAKEAVTRKNRVSALAALRSKKMAETTLEKRHATLAQLEEVFAKIEQAADQVELVRVMKASTRVLSGLNEEVGGVERVDEVVEKLREQMGSVDEVGDVIAEVGREAGNVDEMEVDDELEAMEREEREKKEAEETRKRLDALEEVEREAAAKKAKEAARKQAESDAATEHQLDDSTEILKRMSLDPSTVLEAS
ncbi:hypothetical protein G7Y89_g15706 [Cudoniella acicularis]|uniref:Uncharacterized protein n=1 Tax=Cudoniella acicularis TaxID=354080 RepID=A0A8H4QFY5_9HELO|nr:hypothetical protein G7Y89_g15706 [Cudoniella acicularis]